MPSEFPPIEQLVPHRGPMRLVDRVIASNESSISVVATLDRSPQFTIEADTVLTYVGLEMMAQAISAYDGLQRQGEQSSEIGYLLGCRRFTAHRATLPKERELIVSATVTFHDGPMAVFDCDIVDGHEERIAEGTLSVYRPSQGSSNAGAKHDD